MIRNKYYLKRGNGFGVGGAVEGEGRGEVVGKRGFDGRSWTEAGERKEESSKRLSRDM